MIPLRVRGLACNVRTRYEEGGQAGVKPVFTNVQARGSSMRAGTLVVLGAVAAATPVRAQAPVDFRKIYVKREVMIPMRDGVRLSTTIYLPRDSAQPAPILMRRTPYSCAPYGADAYPGGGVGLQWERYSRAGYILVCQDVRGTYESEGTYANVRPYLPVKRGPQDIDETTDTYDTVDWLVKNLKHSNGRVGIFGISYPGFYTWMGTIDAHPAVKATSPQAPVSEWMGGDDFYHNGALLLPHAFDFYANFGRARPQPTTRSGPRFDHGTPDGYAFFLRLGPLANADAKYFHGEIAFWDTLVAKDHWDDYWAARAVLPHLTNTRPATLVVGGWFDTENLFGALNSYAANEKQSPNASNRLVMGPWYHGEWNRDDGESLGAIAWGQATSRFYVDSIEGPFFDHYLKDAPLPNAPEATVFNTGAKQWVRFDAWPPKTATVRRLVLGAAGRLDLEGSRGRSGSGSAERSTGAAASAEYDQYVSDPAKPVPYIDRITHWYDPDFMLADQRFAAERPDVLVYQTDPLTEDVTVAGPFRVHLTASTSGTDADFVVKLIDVFPDDAGGPTTRARGDETPRLGGYQMLIRGDVLRGKFRNGLDKPMPFVPDEPTDVSFTMQAAFHTFKAGHRIMVQMQSTWFPMVDLNPGVFMHVYEAKASDFRATTQRVYHTAGRPSYLELMVLP
jgi:putative CocE/NonD family hydrolase